MNKASPPLDMIATALSAGCLVHCLGLPIAASLLPTLGVLEEREWVHWALVALAAPVSIAAFQRTGRAFADSWALPIMATVGVCALILGAAGWPDHSFETPLTVAGSLILAAAHATNFARRHLGC